jgi:hypothetical protein
MTTLAAATVRKLMLGFVLGGTFVSSSCTSEQVGTSSSAIYQSGGALLPRDTRFPQVAQLSDGCTATMVAPDIFVTAAHCVGGATANYATFCKPYTSYLFSLAVTIERNGIKPTGPNEDPVSFGVIGVQVAPGGFIRDARECPSGSAGDCSHQQNLNNFANNRGADIALLKVSPIDVYGQRTLASLNIKPLRVITGLHDTWSGNPYAIHIKTSSNWTSGAPAKIPFTRAIGWGDTSGNKDIHTWPNDRHSGVMQIHTHSTWPKYPFDTSGDAAPIRCDGTAIASPGQYDGLRLLNIASPDNFAGYGAGDSGGALVVSGYSNDSWGAPDVPAGDFLMGVISGYSLSGEARSALLAGYGVTFDANNSPTTTFIGKWLEERLLDFDGDGAPDSTDNCAVAYNPDQANCNADSETAWNLRGGYSPGNALYAPLLGDACDPVPCALADMSAGPFGQTGPGGNPVCNGQTQTCRGRQIWDEIDHWKKGSASIWAASGPKLPGEPPVAVSVANTRPRFCQRSTAPYPNTYDCLDKWVIQDDRLQLGVSDPALEMNSPLQPYHRVTVEYGACPVVFKNPVDGTLVCGWDYTSST